MQALDPRLLKVTVTIGGTNFVFENLAIRVNGVKYANALNDEAEVTIYNMRRDQQDFILTQTSPYRIGTQTNSVTVEAGRESYGTSVIYTGFIVLSSMTQPPDIGVTLRCMSFPLFNQNSVVVNAVGKADLETVAKQIAQTANLSLTYQATAKTIANPSRAGSPNDMVVYLNSFGNINAYIDGRTLVVKDYNVPLQGTFRKVSAENGMIGIPEFTELGIKVRFFIDNKTSIGGEIGIESKLYPAANGNYCIYKLGFELANRDIPFYYLAEAAYLNGVLNGNQ